MNLYLMIRTNAELGDAYDEMTGAVVRAASPVDAITIINDICTAHEQWDAVPLSVDGVAGVILSEFHAG